MLSGNKKFLETDYLVSHRDRGISPVSFWSWGQKPKFYILPHPELRKGNSGLPQGEVNSEIPRQSHRGII